VNDIPHLRQIDARFAAEACARAIAAVPDDYGVQLEAEAFRVSRTPWDATRLANALAITHLRGEGVWTLVLDLDAAAEDCAGMAPSNRLPRDPPDYDGISG